MEVRVSSRGAGAEETLSVWLLDTSAGSSWMGMALLTASKPQNLTHTED